MTHGGFIGREQPTSQNADNKCREAERYIAWCFFDFFFMTFELVPVV